MKNKFRVNRGEAGQRIDVYLSSKTGKSRSFIQQMIRDVFVMVNEKRIKPSYKVGEGDLVEITFPEEEISSLVPEAIPLQIFYKDEYLIVVNKPPNKVMYPAAGHRDGTLMNAIAFHADRLSTVGTPLRPGVVHRLDKDTSGPVVVALSDDAYHGLVQQFKERSIKRVYRALIFGNIKEESGEIDFPIGRSPVHRKKMSTRVKRGRSAKTLWKVIERYQQATLIEAQLATGRTHQIRVHFSALGHPVLGDRVYGRKVSIKMDHLTLKIPRQMLHAESLGIEHPISGKWLEFHAPLPEDMIEIISALKKKSRLLK